MLRSKFIEQDIVDERLEELLLKGHELSLDVRVLWATWHSCPKNQRGKVKTAVIKILNTYYQIASLNQAFQELKKEDEKKSDDQRHQQDQHEADQFLFTSLLHT